MTPITVSDLEAQIITAIEGVTPRTAYQSSAWSAYERRGEHRRREPMNTGPKLGSTRTRRFRLSLTGQPMRDGAVWESGAVETDVLGTYIYQLGVGSSDFAMASAMSIFVLLLTVALSWAYVRNLVKEDAQP